MRDTDKLSLTIHRYSSRKLYNKNTREFVTLDDISRLIRAGHSVTILDKKTGEDITNQYLLTIISEFEGQGEPVIPKDFLTEIIKGYSDAATQVWPKAIEQMMQAYQKNQQNFVNMKKRMEKQIYFKTVRVWGWQKFVNWHQRKKEEYIYQEQEQMKYIVIME